MRVIFKTDSLIESGAEALLRSSTFPIRLGFQLQRLFTERSNQRFVFGRYDNDPGVSDGVPAPIFLLVVADKRAAGNEDVALDDGAADPRVAADADARHQDALLDVAETV